jgi:long-chain acyl-CoA synthetase
MLASDILNSDSSSSVAILFGTETYSYQDLDRLSNKFAHFFLSFGAEHQNRVSFLMNNDPMMVAAYFGAFRAGLIANPINNKLKPPEIAYILNHAEPVCVITTQEFLPVLKSALASVTTSPKILLLRSSGPVEMQVIPEYCVHDASHHRPTQSAPDTSDGALLLYTSGTTGNPKGVLLTHANVVAGATLTAKGFELSPRDRTMCVMPIFHTNGLMFSHMPHLLSKSSIVLHSRFSASSFWEQCRDYKATSSSASPTILSLLLEHEASAPPASDIHLDFIKVASAPTSKELAERFEKRFGSGLLLETFGLTETTAINAMNPLRGKRKVCSIGQALGDQEIKIIDSTGHEIGPNLPGEMLIRGPTVMTGYFKDPDNTRHVLKDGWLYSGDIAYKDTEGYVFIVGRKKEMIIRGGENISPLEIESVALQFPGVGEAAATGIPDGIWGEVVALAIVETSPVDRAALDTFLVSHLSDFRLPKRILTLDALPRNALGKIKRGELRELFLQTPVHKDN